MLLFGRLADVAGWRDAEVEATSLHALRDTLTATDSALGEALQGPGVQAAVDKVIVRGDAPLTAASEVAFLPPMSGG